MPSAKEKKRLAADAADQTQAITEDRGAGSQLQQLTDLVTSLLKTIEEQKQAHAAQIEEQQQAHARQIEEQKQTLTKVFTQQSKRSKRK